MAKYAMLAMKSEIATHGKICHARDDIMKELCTPSGSEVYYH